MKKLFIIAIIAFGMSAKAQISFEHDYDSASSYASGIPALSDQLMIVNFEITGERYVKINRHGKKINIYDLNHSLINTIDYSSYPQTTSGYTYFLYFSQSLFNIDQGIEFMYCYNAGTPSCVTNIYKENGTLLFSDTAGPAIITNILQQQFPIYNTSQGTKMILSYPNGHAKVFSLPGTLSLGIAEANNNLISIQTQNIVSNAYPNPTNNRTRIDYILPDGVNDGEIVFYNLQGTEIKRFKVDRTFNTLLISTADIASGTYLYQLQTNEQNSESKKLIIIK